MLESVSAVLNLWQFISRSCCSSMWMRSCNPSGQKCKRKYEGGTGWFPLVASSGWFADAGRVNSRESRLCYSLKSRNCCSLFRCSADTATSLRGFKIGEEYISSFINISKGCNSKTGLTSNDPQRWWLSCRWQSWAWPAGWSAVFYGRDPPCCRSTCWVYWKREATWSVCPRPEEDKVKDETVLQWLKHPLEGDPIPVETMSTGSRTW